MALEITASQFKISNIENILNIVIHKNAMHLIISNAYTFRIVIGEKKKKYFIDESHYCFVGE
jgi:hypothetical protein